MKNAVRVIFFILCKGTRGNGRVGKMGSGRERVGTETGIPSAFRSRPRLPEPFPTLVSVPTVYHPDSRHLVVVPTVSRAAVRCIPDFSRPAFRPVVPIKSRRSHTVSPIPLLTAVVADVPIPFTIYHRLCVFFLTTLTMDATGLFQFGLFKFGCSSCSNSLFIFTGM